ncbi:MAG: helix-turn-helix domain-containing protein [Candidatus Heimdallarchaeota archaeon]
MAIKSDLEKMVTNSNDRLVLKCLVAENRGLTRDEIAYHTGIPRTTTFDSLQRLVIKNIVEVESEGRITVGRPKRLYTATYPLLDQKASGPSVKLEKETFQRI